MKIYPPPEGLTKKQLEHGHAAVYTDVTCPNCGKEQALTNTKAGTCMACGACVYCGVHR